VLRFGEVDYVTIFPAKYPIAGKAPRDETNKY